MSTRKLLLADDSITIQKVVNLTFADEGIEVISVGNGDEAMEKLVEFSPDLVMADVNMPGLNGYQVCEQIKQDDNFRQTPVILLVGSFEPFDEEEAKRVGADDFLTKPFQSIRQLVNKVTVLLESNDKNAAQLYEATANSSFADTLDMEKSEVAEVADSSNLGDAGMDDEIIQTSEARSFAFDESSKFETREVFESYEANKTQPLSVYDLKEFSFVASKDGAETSEKDAPQIAEEDIDAKTDYQAEEKTFSEFQDEDDLLEIPYDEEEDLAQIEESDTESAQIAKNEFNGDAYEENQVAAEEVVSQSERNYSNEDNYAENEIVVGNLTEPLTDEERTGEFKQSSESRITPEAATSFSPELIDAIAQRVVEKLSDRIVLDIAWEVVPQHAELIIKKAVADLDLKKMVEDQPKD